MSDDNKQHGKLAPETPEELVSLAQEYFSHDFPQSGGDCLSPGEIAKIIESGKLPEEALRTHLLTCSRCFVTYRECLQRSRVSQAIGNRLWLRISELLRNPWRRILVPTLPVLLLALLAVVYFRAKNPHENRTLVDSPAEVVKPNANVQTTASPASVQIDSSHQIERATHVARVDLRTYSTRRGNEPSEEQPPLQIEPKQTAFTIMLPEGSPPGTYSVSIRDAFGKAIKTRTSHSVDGKRLTATLNLDNLRNQKYRLCVSRSDEPPNCYPVVITKRGK